MAPWIVGVIFAYFMFTQRDKRVKWNAVTENAVGVHFSVTDFPILHTSQVQVALCWSIIAAIAVTLSYYSYSLQQIDHVATPMESGIYTPISRLAWSIFLCLVIYACTKGYGGPVNWFLSLAIWQPLARLTYAVYLVHMPIMLMTVSSTHRPLYFSGRNVVSHWPSFYSIFLSNSSLIGD